MAGPVKTLVPIPFAGGIDSKTDPAQVQPGKLADLQNGVFRQTGAVGRRWGYKALGKTVLDSASDIAACKAVQPFNEELLLFDGQQAYSYIEADDAWARKGSVVSVIQSNQQIVAGTSQQISPDFGSLSGIEVYAWEDSRGGIRYSVLDAASGTIVVNDQPLFAGMNAAARAPKVIPFAAAGTILIFFDDGYGNVAYCKVNPANPTTANLGADTVFNGTVSIAPGASVGVSPVTFDAAVSGDGTKVCLACVPTPVVLVGSVQFYLVAIDATLHRPAAWPAVSFFSMSPTGNLRPIVSLVADAANNRILVLVGNVYSAGVTSIQVSAFNLATGSSVYNTTAMTVTRGSAIPFESVAGILVGTTLTVFAEMPVVAGGSSTNPMAQRLYKSTFNTSTHAAGATTLFKTSVGLASKPFQYNGLIYVNVAFQSALQSTYFTLDSSGNVIGKVFSGLCGGLVANSDYMLPECQAIASGIFKYANLVKGFPNTEAGAVVALLGVNATKLDFFDSNNFLSSAINGSLHTVGGVLQAYDGAQFVELGFNVYPEGITLAAAGGGGQGAGTYYYAVTYEWNDNNDRTDYSTPSPVASITLTAGQSVNITVPTLKLTKKTRVKIVIYRSTANGDLLYRVTSAVAPTYNDATVDTITFNDVLSDTSIQSNGLLYTQPLVLGENQVVPNSAPPACSLIATFANRLFVGGLDDPYTLAFTQEALANSTMQFSNLLTMRSDPDGGPITAIQRMDDKLIIFKSNAIFYLTGQGPTPTGDQNDFGVPLSIPSGEVGCASQNSIVLTPVGLLFQSSNGIYLLDRGLNVSYKGSPVEAFNSLSITSATLVPNQWVVFTTSTGLALVYDYYYDQWSTFTNHNAVDSALYLGASNLFVFAQANGQVLMQTPSTFTDNGFPIPFSLTTAPINPGVLSGALQGFLRVYHAFLLGTYKGSHNLSIGVAFDYEKTFTNVAAIPVDATLGVSTFGSGPLFGSEAVFGGVGQGQSVYQFRVDVLRKCMAVQFKITDQQSAPGNEGFSLSALSLVVGLKPGGNRVPTLKQFGAA